MVTDPKIFISYSHDNEEHKDWVYRLATDLMNQGIDTILDQWDLSLGANLPKFMEKGLSESDRILVVCTDNYINKSNDGIAGVGYENTILTAELLLDQNTIKFIPIVKSVTKRMKTPLCLAGRFYIDFTDNNEYDEALNQLVHEIYGVKKRPKPKLGKNPFLRALNEDNRPEMKEDSTTFFYKRFCSAFPGVRDITWFNADEAIERLSILLAKPLDFQDGSPIWWWRSGALHIHDFQRIDEEHALMDNQELKIKRIAAVYSGSYYQSFVYVEVEPMPPSGLYEIDVNSEAEYSGYSREEFAIFNGTFIKREEYDDNAAIIDGKPVNLDGKAELRIRYLTPYNFIIAPHNSPINNSTYDRRRNDCLNEIIRGQKNVEDLASEIFNLPRRGY